MGELAGKVAVVTGAGRGIGLAVVRALVKEGAVVVGGARTVTADLLAATPHTVEADLTGGPGPAELAGYAVRELGGIDILVNNVGGGVTMTGGFLDTDDETWRQAFDLNFYSAVRTIRAALPSLLERRGSIVNIGSVNAKLIDPKLLHYTISKSALSLLGKALSVEFSARGLRVNTISPGPVKTDIWTNPDWEAKTGMTPDQLIAKVPAMFGMTTGKMIEVDEVVTLVLLLAGGGVPSLTGADLIVDAGILKTA